MGLTKIAGYAQAPLDPETEAKLRAIGLSAAEQATNELAAAEQAAAKRIDAAVAIIDAAPDKLYEQRDYRDIALVVLKLQRNWRNVRCYELVGVERRVFELGALNRYSALFAEPPRPGSGDVVSDADDLTRFYWSLLPLSDDEVAGIAVKHGRRYDRLMSEMKTAMQVRDEAIVYLVNVANWPNADLSRKTGLKDSAICQLAKGNRDVEKQQASDRKSGAPMEAA